MLVGGPALGNASDDAGSAAFFIPLDELLNCEVVHVHALDRVSEDVWILNLKYFVLPAPVVVGAPRREKHLTALLTFHVVHLLNELVRHAAGFESSVSEPMLLGKLDGLRVNDVFDRELPEELTRLLLLFSCIFVPQSALFLLFEGVVEGLGTERSVELVHFVVVHLVVGGSRARHRWPPNPRGPLALLFTAFIRRFNLVQFAELIISEWEDDVVLVLKWLPAV